MLKFYFARLVKQGMANGAAPGNSRRPQQQLAPAQRAAVVQSAAGRTRPIQPTIYDIDRARDARRNR